MIRARARGGDGSQPVSARGPVGRTLTLLSSSGSFQIATGAAIGQLALVVSSPLLSRLYSPGEFGVLAVFTALVSVLAVPATGRLELAIPLPEDDDDARHLVQIAVVGSVLFGLVCLPILIVFAGQLARLLGTPGLEPFAWLISPGVVSVALFAVLTGWLVRCQNYTGLARRSVFQGVSQVAIQLGLGFRTGALGLIAGFIGGRAITVGASPGRAHGRRRRGLLPLSGARRMVARYRRFAALATGSGLLNTASAQLPYVLLAALYGSATAGLLGMTVRIAALPVLLIGQSVSQVFLGDAAIAARSSAGELSELFRNTARRLFKISLVVCVVLAAASPAVFGVILGHRWHEAGVYTSIMAAGFLMQLTVSPVSQTLTVMARQDLQLAWDAGRVAAVVLAITGVHAVGLSARVAVLSYSMTLVVSYGVLFWAIRHALAQWVESSPDDVRGRIRS
jgi:O-antigen/teichoic acid export membrane protein